MCLIYQMCVRDISFLRYTVYSLILDDPRYWANCYMTEINTMGQFQFKHSLSKTMIGQSQFKQHVHEEEATTNTGMQVKQIQEYSSDLPLCVYNPCDVPDLLSSKGTKISPNIREYTVYQSLGKIYFVLRAVLFYLLNILMVPQYISCRFYCIKDSFDLVFYC